jgi:hypothetical protein
MWNNWVEKAKDLATNIDNQLNEAVGADADPNNPASSSIESGAAATSSSSSLLNAGGATTDNNNDDDAWNDDFDFGDDEDDGDNKKDLTSAPKNSTETQVQSESVSVAASISTPYPAAGTDTSSPPKGLSPAAQLSVDDNSTFPKAEDSEPPAKPTEAGWEEDNDDIEFSNNNDEECDVAVHMDPQPPEKFQEDDVETNTTDLVEDIGNDTSAKEENKESNIESIVPTTSIEPSLATKTANPSKVDSTTPTLEDVSAIPAQQADESAQNDGDNEVTKERPSLFSNLAHRAEGFAHRAEGLLAHQTEGGVSSLLAAASHLGDNIARVRSDHGNDNAPSTTKTSAGVSSLFTSALSGATAAVVSATSTDDKEKDGEDDDTKDDIIDKEMNTDDGAWDEDDDDLEMTETEGGDDAIVIPNQTKSDASHDGGQVDHSDEVVEDLAPSTTEDITKLENQSAAEETPSYVSVSEPESVLVESTEPSPLSSDAEKHDRGASVPRETNIATSTSPIAGNIEDDPRYLKLKEQLRLREDQLANKAEQLTELQSLMESQECDFKTKLAETKEEAKKRMQRAKERCEAAEAKLALKSTSGAEDSAKQDGIIKALREEGQALAMKQAAMEQAVRAAKAESRQLAEQLDAEASQKEQALEKITILEMELKITKDSLSAARKGESQAGKLESDLLAARSDAEAKANTILSLQQQIKELTNESKELRGEIQSIRKAAAHEAQQEKSSLRREHNDIITDLEIKLRTTEREAGVREDALRHEVAELRKRWQDAVRRADGKLIMIFFVRALAVSKSWSDAFSCSCFLLIKRSAKHGHSVEHCTVASAIGKYGAAKSCPSIKLGGVGRPIAK